jgi:DNA helicase IV
VLLLRNRTSETWTGIGTIGQEYAGWLRQLAATKRGDDNQPAKLWPSKVMGWSSLTEAEWQMLLLRCPSRSFTIVGDRAQARHGFTGPDGANESWAERLERVGFNRVGMASLSINYRTPEEVMAEAEPIIREVLPDANVPTSVRGSGIPVKRGSVSELRSVLDAWLSENTEGTACVIGDPDFRAVPRVRSLTPELAKGLEFDLVVLIDPEGFGEGIEGAVDRYVAMTRATSQLVILTSP